MALLLVAGNAAAVLRLTNAHERRKLEYFSYLLTHLDWNSAQSKMVMEVIMSAPYRGDGPAAFDYVRLQCCRAPKAMEIFEMKRKLMDTSIRIDIGFHEDTISDLRSYLVVNNARLPFRKPILSR